VGESVGRQVESVRVLLAGRQIAVYRAAQCQRLRGIGDRLRVDGVSDRADFDDGPLDQQGVGSCKGQRQPAAVVGQEGLIRLGDGATSDSFEQGISKGVN